MKDVKAKSSQKTGLTIVEIIVVAALIGIISTVVISNYREFDKRIVLGNLAYDVSLSIRLAQSYGLNVRSDGGVFDTSYGVHFADANPITQYVLFKDVNRIDGGGYGYFFGGVDVKVYKTGKGYTLSEVCAVQTPIAGGLVDCLNGTGNGSNITYLDIMFDRPKPDSRFRSSSGTEYESATITVTGPTGLSRTVKVLATGYISVQ